MVLLIYSAPFCGAYTPVFTVVTKSEPKQATVLNLALFSIFGAPFSVFSCLSHFGLKKNVMFSYLVPPLFTDKFKSTLK
jgi:hypothetical protein